MRLITDGEAALIRLVAAEAEYGNPYTVKCEEATDAEDLRLRGLLAWAGKDSDTGRDAYEWTERGAMALAAYDEAQAGIAAAMGVSKEGT